MRVSLLATLPLLGALALAPQRANAQVSVSLRLGSPVAVTTYSQESYGDWQKSYRRWTPVTLWYYDGHWYKRQMRGGRAVTVYSSGGHYFLPPREDGWNKREHRFNAKRWPNDDDYNHAEPPPPPRSRPQASPPRGRPGGV